MIHTIYAIFFSNYFVYCALASIQMFYVHTPINCVIFHLSPLFLFPSLSLSLSSLTNLFGYIHDGAGNYSVGVKCSWLIDAREHSVYSNTLRNNVKIPTIRLHLEEFATECGWDHLYVFDGDSVESPLLAVYRLVTFAHTKE